MAFLTVFAMPTIMKITTRTSTITNAFANAIIPAVKPKESEVREALEVLGLDSNDLRCAYCGDPSTEWDHLRPLVRDKKPTGYISEIANLVPSCGKCNQSKGGQSWREWISGPARRSPASREVPNLQERIGRLEAFEGWRRPTQVDFQTAVEHELWSLYWENHARLLNLMNECQRIADRVKRAVEAHAEA